MAVGCTRPLVETKHGCPQIHGNDSLGDLSPPVPTSRRKPVDDHAVTFLQKLLSKREKDGDKPLTIIALGPLTNIAMLVRLAPELFKRAVGRVVWMGGGASTGGNFRSWTEANAGYDPEAAKIVIETCGVDFLMYTWDVYVKVAYSKQELVDMKLADINEESSLASESTKGDVSVRNGLTTWSTLSTRLFLRDMAHFKMSSAMIGDAGAVAVAILGAKSVTTSHRPVAVELRGERTRGMTVVDHRLEVCCVRCSLVLTILCRKLCFVRRHDELSPRFCLFRDTTSSSFARKYWHYRYTRAHD